ncbi:MAG TPA: FapA family protein [Spirochaetia bacterium]|nr:FapA family protein [Spirochaetia bacterium]HRZ65220.1 FapA family protein [Spirochaetia bacterium]
MAQAVAKGDLALTIDEGELEASISYSPDPNGAEWGAEKVLRLLMDARVAGFNQKRAEELVAKLSRAKGPVTEIVAAGQAPEPPQPEQPEWSELAVPPELAEAVSSAAAAASPPRLYKLVSETVKVEKTVRKPAALPFLPPKVEKVLVAERRERREEVRPDPAVLRAGYARKGERLALLSAAKPGKPGKTIFGRPLQAPAEETSFFAGDNVVRRKNELLAEADGVVRVGERWVDIVPLHEHRWSVELSPDGATFFLNYAPGDARFAPPSASAILARAVELGAPAAALIPEAELAALVAEAASSGEPIYSRSLSTDRDAKVEVGVNADKTRAALSIWKGRGRGRPLDLAMVSAALKASGLRGFKAEQLKKDVLEFYKGKSTELLDYLLVEGRAPGRGKDRVFTCQASFLPEAEAAALRARLAAAPGLAQAAPSLADFPLEAAARLAWVQLGQKVGELPPQSAGSPGVDVFGKALAGIPGNDPPLRVFEGIDLSKGAATATAAGVLLVGEVEGVTCLRVLPCRDSSIDVELAPDASSASVSLVAEEGLGQVLTIEAILAAFAAKGVVQGLEPFAIGEAVADARAGKPVLKRVVARGRAPRPGGSLQVDWLVHKATGALYSLRGDRADFKEHDTMTRVEAGMPLLKVTKTGDAGEDGSDVLGRPVKAAGAEGADRPPEHDESIREERQEDGSLLYVAAVSGELVVEGLFGQGGRVSVREHLAISGDIGQVSGNIRFPGSVRVSGSVRAGFSLVAGGEIAVSGGVEAALVSGDLGVRIGEGVKGSRKGTVRARAGIEAAFAEQALLLAVEDVRLKTGCVLCNVKTNGRLIVTADKGALIGGLVRARKGIDVCVLGSENCAKTEVSFGQDYLVADQIEAEEREIERVKGLILQADRTMASLEGVLGDSAGLDRVRQDKVKLMKLLEKRTVRLFDLREKFEEHVASEVRVRGVVHPGVILESHNRFFEVKSRRSQVAFSFDPRAGRIVERPLTG